MTHPLTIIPEKYRRPLFLAFLLLTLVLFAVFRVLDRPLRTEAAPNGIVSFELAGTAPGARAITGSWKQTSLLLSATGEPNPEIVNVPYAFAAFGLGLDYLFMPVYALALGLGTLLVSHRHRGWLKTLGALAGYGALAAVLFDAVENYALFRVLLGWYDTGAPETAAFCAVIKFGLLVFGMIVWLIAWLAPKRTG